MSNFISTDPNDPRSRGMMVNPIQVSAPVKNNEEKIYIILIKSEDDEYDGRYEICIGRTATYEKIQTLVDVMDIHTSVIITETMQTETRSGDTKYFLIDLPDAKTVYGFCKQIEGMYGDSFDIEKYNDMDNVELTEAQQNYAFNTNSEAARLWDQVIKEQQSEARGDYESSDNPEYNV